MRLIFSVLILLIIHPLVNCQIPIGGLVAYYPFNGNANEALGVTAGIDGVLYNNVTGTMGLTGSANSALHFDGTADSRIDVPDNPLFNFGLGDYTTSMWLKYSSPQQNDLTYSMIYCKGGFSTPGLCAFADFLQTASNTGGQSAGGITLRSRYDNYASFSANGEVNNNEWHHFIFMRRGSFLKIYIDGFLRANRENPLDSIANNYVLRFGANQDFANSQNYKGSMDEVRFYNRALCDAEIAQLYDAEKPSTPPINLNTGLVAYYPFNGNSNDESGNGNHLTQLNGLLLTSDRSGQSDKAFHFDGVDDYLSAPYSASLNSVNYADGYTFCAWVKTAGDYFIFCKPSGYDLHYRFWGNLNAIQSQCDTYYSIGSISITPDKWTSIICVKKNGHVYFYKNGSMVSLVTATVDAWPVNIQTPLEIGRDAHGPVEYTNGSLDDIRIYNRPLTEAEIQLVSENYTYYSCVLWNTTPPTLDPETKTAFDYLCSKDVILHTQISGAENNKIRKDEIAKIIFRGLFTPNVNATTPVDDAVNPFEDLQPNISAYSRESKVLSYLEYGDGISVFKRELSHFRPQFPLQRKYIVKAMLEAFNIKPYTPANAPTPSCWYNDVPVNNDMYYYILKAREMGFVKQQEFFRPDSSVTRKEAFLILYRILKYFETNPKPSPVLADYFVPCNIKPDNFGRSLGISDGNFNAYTKTSFAIGGLMPLTFAHSYNSAYTELPDSSYNIIEPLGKGWTHNYNCYLQRVADDRDSNIHYVITWGDGTMNSFTKDSNGVFIPDTKGIYSTLTVNGDGSVYTFKTKSQVRYEFTRYVLSTRTLWVLTSVKDRNNNALTLLWTPYPQNVIVPSQIRLFKVQDAGGRYLQFGYEVSEPSKIKTVTAITGNITRSISFSYRNNFTDLCNYVNPRGDTTTYYYEDSADLTKNHLLKQIKLPKGNLVDNTYENRKLKSTQMAGQYLTNVNTSFNYTATNNTNFTESNISTTRNGITLNTNVKADQLGNIKNAISPTGNLSLAYNDSTHSTKPTNFSNSVNNLSANTVYDSMGNALSVTKMGGSINIKDSFTYNGFNDILTYINARGFATMFTYNDSGNLTKIKDAMGNETNMQVNTNGTVNKVTNPEDIYTDFLYDAFGNTTQSQLMNTITAGAVYDGASRLIEKTDPNGIKTTIIYDVNDLVKQVIADAGGLNNKVMYDYDKNDNLLTITNPKGGKTNLTYNSYDQLVEYRFGPFTKAYAYNEDGTLNTFTNQNGHSFNYSYNPDGTLANDGYAAFNYDAEYNVTAISKGSTTINFGYDALKRTNSIIYNDFTGNNVQYAYDNNSNVTAITYPGGFKVGYEYDSLDRLKRVYHFASNSNYATYTYYKDGRLKTQTNGNGTKTIYGYDSYGRLDSIANLKNNNSNIASYKFTMDNTGNHLSETNYEPGLPIMAALQNETISYTHDSLNRMLTRNADGYTYNNNGNNIATSSGSTFTYDEKDNLLTSSIPALTCEYDALENRRRKNDTIYVLVILGGSNVLMETDAAGSPYAYYIHGLGLICRLDAAQTNPHYYHYDYRGSTTAITNSSETITHQYRYGAFGEMMMATETGFKNPYRYVGKYGVQYEDSSLYFMRARYYNPNKGRFLGEDPVWGVNLYGYGNNNPIMYSDKSGKAADFLEEVFKGVNENGGSISLANQGITSIEKTSSAASVNSHKAPDACTVAANTLNEIIENIKVKNGELKEIQNKLQSNTSNHSYFSKLKTQLNKKLDTYYNYLNHLRGKGGSKIANQWADKNILPLLHKTIAVQDKVVLLENNMKDNQAEINMINEEIVSFKTNASNFGPIPCKSTVDLQKKILAM